MRVLQISKFYAPDHGGIETTVRELSRGLCQAGIRTDVLCANRRPVTRRSVVGGVQVTRAASFGTLLSTSMAPAMIGLLRQMAPSYGLLHVHMPDPMAALALRLAAPRTPLVVHWHSDVLRQRRALRLYEPLQQWLLRRADAIVATSEAYAEASGPLQAWRRKVQVMPIGIADRREGVQADLVSAWRGRHPGQRIVLALGRMTHYKGFDVLVDGAAELPQDVVVWIGGTGDGMAALSERIARRGLQSRVHLLGEVSDDDLLACYAACDVFCLPSTSRAEAFGVAIIEAMMMGRPVVATDIPGSGVPWVNCHGETGLQVPVGDAQALAAALRTVLDDEALRLRLGDGGRQRYLQEFTVAGMTRRMAALYRQLMATSHMNGPDA